MTAWIQETRNGFEMAEEEMNRIEATPVQGVQSIMVQSDMLAWAVKKGMWPNESYECITAMYAIDRGWLQEYSTGMEIIQ